MSLPFGEAELMETAVHRVHGVKHVADVASLRGSGINGNKGSLTHLSCCIVSLPFGEAELMETSPALLLRALVRFCCRFPSGKRN